ncbi:hypothetical protein QYM36_013148 [Artemia franciscana]|nr:hypothetical protein QYM36_013148 [Artemia franciscana]
MPDGSFNGSITLANITHIEISCNYTRIDINGNCLMSLLVPDHELCLSIVSSVEHLRRNFGLIDTIIRSPNYELLKGNIFASFILRDVDGGGAFQLDVSDETASGHMMYCRLHKEKVIRWVSGFFVLRGRVLQCFTAAKSPHAKWDIPLRESGMRVTLGSNANYRPNTIELWYQSKTVLILAASSSEEAYKWFSKISRTLDALSPVKIHRPLTLQHRILVLNSSGIFLLKWDKKHLRQEISAKLEQIGTIKLDPELDSAFLSVDFEWQEAEDLAGDWVLHYPSWKHMEEFLSSIRDHLPDTAEICYFEEGSYLLQRCRNVSEVLSFDYTEEK